MRARTALAVALAIICSAAAGGPAATAASRSLRTYVVDGVRTSLDRYAVAGTGAAIVEADHTSRIVSASRGGLRRLRAPRHRAPRLVARHQAAPLPAAPARPAGLPPT